MYFFTKAALILLYYSALYHYYHHDHHHHDHDHDLDQAEAEPPPTFRWLDAENQPVTDGQVVNDQYKVPSPTHSRNFLEGRKICRSKISCVSASQ